MRSTSDKRALRRVPTSVHSPRGFTLIELLVVVVIMGVIATIGVASYQEHRDDAKITQALAVCRSIGVAQEQYFSLNRAYLDVSTNLATYYPDATPTSKPKRWEWDIVAHTDSPNWSVLQPQVPVAVRYRFATVAGLPGDVWPAVNTTQIPAWPTNQVDPWYVIQAVGDLDDDTNYSYILMTSFNDNIFIEERGE